MKRARMMKVKLTLRDDIEVTPEVSEWLRCCEAKISEECGKVESEIKRRISLGIPVVIKDGKLVNVEDIKVAAHQAEVEAEKTLRFLRTGRQHD